MRLSYDFRRLTNIETKNTTMNVLCWMPCKATQILKRTNLLLKLFFPRDEVLIIILEGVLGRILIYFNDSTAAGQ